MLLLAALALPAADTARPAGAASRSATEGALELPESTLKAGFVYNIARYIEWPEAAFAAADAAIVIGVLGDDPFDGELERVLAGKVLRSRSFRVVRLDEIATTTHCHILFVVRAGEPRTRASLARLGTAPVVTVGEEPGFCRWGGAVNILIEDGLPQLEVNPDAAAAAGLIIDARLLKASRLVRNRR